MFSRRITTHDCSDSFYYHSDRHSLIQSDVENPDSTVCVHELHTSFPISYQYIFTIRAKSSSYLRVRGRSFSLVTCRQGACRRQEAGGALALRQRRALTSPPQRPRTAPWNTIRSLVNTSWITLVNTSTRR